MFFKNVNSRYFLNTLRIYMYKYDYMYECGSSLGKTFTTFIYIRYANSRTFNAFFIENKRYIFFPTTNYLTHNT